MKIDMYKLEIEQARTGKGWRELGVDLRLIAKIKKGQDIQPLTAARLAQKIGVDIERIATREG